MREFEQASSDILPIVQVPNDLEKATQHHSAGQLAEAEQGYRRVLTANPRSVEAYNRLGLLLMQTRRYPAAIETLLQAIAFEPANPFTHYTLAITQLAAQNFAAARESALRAVQFKPDLAEAHFALGGACQGLIQFPSAIAAYQKAIALQPKNADAHTNLGNVYQMMGKPDMASHCYTQALAANPNHPEALNNLASLCQNAGRTDQAIALYQRAVQSGSGAFLAWNNLGNALHAKGQLPQAKAAIERAIQINPKFAEAYFNLGNVHVTMAQHSLAREAFVRAVALQPKLSQAHNNLGNCLQTLGDHEGAVAAYLKAVEHQPSNTDALSNLGVAYRAMGRIDEACLAFERALAIAPQSGVAWSNLGNAYKDGGDVPRALQCYRKAADLRPDQDAAMGNFVYTIYYIETDPRRILQAAKEYDERYAKGLASQIQPHRNNRQCTRRLRIGYVSPHFKEHCLMLFVPPLLANHDHEKFEIVVYATGTGDDRFTAALKPRADIWHQLRGATDAQLAQRIRNDEIDILVDLTMHMGSGQPLTFARKPAPVQVAWLAYPGTTGLSAIDYRLSDPRLDPPGTDGDYAEKTIRLPDTFWCYDPTMGVPDNVTPSVNDLPAKSNAFITFGSLNNFCKITPYTLELWQRVLHAVPNSRLLLLTPTGSARQRVVDHFSRAGIDPARIGFHAYSKRQEYLARYHEIDICLDTFPYNGHTTSLDSYWMGVPVVTMPGPTVVGRAGVSQLHNLGLEEMIGRNEDDFVRIAVELAGNLDRVSSLRNTLRDRLAASPLMDGKRFAAGIEAAYRKMWEAWCAS